jgi:aryl sulfotransferase
MGGIVWLASYPKSGNTWMRFFLARLLNPGEEPFTDRVLHTIDQGLGIASARETFDEFAGLESSDLIPEDIDRLRPYVYRAIAAGRDTVYLKVHDAYLFTPENEPLFPLDATRAVIYIARNPVDVAVSLAFHSGITFDAAIDVMASESAVIGGKKGRLSGQLRQRVLSWSGHVGSWLDADIKCHLVRYEDMLQTPFETFRAVIHFLDLPADKQDVCATLDATRFERLREEEDRHGFREKNNAANRFFRDGRVGAWRDHLCAAQVEKILSRHWATMERLGYLGSELINPFASTIR